MDADQALRYSTAPVHIHSVMVDGNEKTRNEYLLKELDPIAKCTSYTCLQETLPTVVQVVLCIIATHRQVLFLPT